MNIITEEATNRAANLIIKLKGSFSKLQAYVGLNDIEQESKFLSIHGKSHRTHYLIYIHKLIIKKNNF